MKLSSVLISLCFAATGSIASCASRLEWSDCDLGRGQPPFPVQCATLTVPLDYSSPNTSAPLDLKLVRVRAINQPSQGTIILNFGGPGVAGREHLAYGRGSMDTFGGRFDLISFDPRGTADTIPVTCFESDHAKKAAMTANPDVWHRVLTSVTAWSDTSDTSLGYVWAAGKVIADQCYKASSDVGKYVGTVSTARDVMRIVDALDEDGLLRYWGTSYGTVLGATIAALFPERVDRMLLDAGANVVDHFHGNSAESISDADKVLARFFEACLEIPSLCALAQLGGTVAELETSFWTLLESIKSNPIPFGDRVIDYSLLKDGVMLSLYRPAGWPIMATGLSNLMQGNPGGFLQYWQYLLGGYNPDNISLASIRCADKDVTYSDFDDFRVSAEDQYNSSRILGGLYPVMDAICSHWNMRSSERIDRDFRVRTKFPVLLIGNSADPMTPLVSMKNLTGHLENSVLLEHGGYGVSPASPEFPP